MNLRRPPSRIPRRSQRVISRLRRAQGREDKLHIIARLLHELLIRTPSDLIFLLKYLNLLLPLVLVGFGYIFDGLRGAIIGLGGSTIACLCGYFLLLREMADHELDENDKAEIHYQLAEIRRELRDLQEHGLPLEYERSISTELRRMERLASKLSTDIQTLERYAAELRQQIKSSKLSYLPPPKKDREDMSN